MKRPIDDSPKDESVDDLAGPTRAGTGRRASSDPNGGPPHVSGPAPRAGVDDVVIKTPRLRLRPHEVEDLPAVLALWADPVTRRFIRAPPVTEATAWSRILNYAGHWKLLDYGYWVVERKDSGAFVGEVGFADARRDMKPSTHGIPELGWALKSDQHGQGFATEALRAVIAWGDEKFGEETQTVCLVHPENLVSIRVAVKCGYRETRRTHYADAPVIIFSRTAPSAPVV